MVVLNAVGRFRSRFCGRRIVRFGDTRFAQKGGLLWAGHLSVNKYLSSCPSSNIIAEDKRGQRLLILMLFSNLPR